MKKLSWKNLGAMLFLSVFLAACGSDDNQQVQTSNVSTQSADAEQEELQGTSDSTGATTVSVSSFAEFKSKVNNSDFSSLDTFKSNMGLQNATSFNVNYVVCNLNSYDAYEAGEDAGFWEKVGDFFTPSLNTSGCSSSFQRTMFGGSIMREDGAIESDVLASLKEIVNSATAGSKTGAASFNVVKDGVSYVIDLNFPVSLNPIYKYQTSDSGDASYYQYHSTQYGY
jgi:hypothetical protein